ncbi:MAG: DJ-1/PfpI family protein [Chlamydiales bacterium]|nr:DJ-1/PfpI family protein [Chlamydiales bacterium]
MARETVHLAIYNTMGDWGVSYAIAHINSPKFQKTPGRYQIKTVGDSFEPIITAGGVRIAPDLTLDMLEPEDSRMLILPGGDSAAAGGIDRFVKLAGRFLSVGVPVAAICGSTVALAKSGLLDELPHTSNAQVQLEMVGYKGSSHYQDDKLAVTAGCLITAGGIAAVEFAFEIFRKLDMYSDTTMRSWYKLFKNQNPEGFYELMEEHAYG